MLRWSSFHARCLQRSPVKNQGRKSFALYVHCNAHILNLCLVDLSKQISHVRNVFGTLSTLHNFINASSKRQAVFDNMRSKLNMKMGHNFHQIFILALSI